MRRWTKLRLRSPGPLGHRLTAPVLLGIATLATGAPVAAAAPPPPTNLAVVGGDMWYADNYFSLTWTKPGPSDPPLTRTRYRVRDSSGAILVEDRVGGVEAGFWLAVPRVSAIYRAEVWFEDSAGGQGQAAFVPLRFDDAQPGLIAPGPVPTWIGRAAFPLRVKLGHPTGQLPQSGIRGYATSIDTDPDGTPCSQADRCTDAETSLREGIGGDVLAIGALPEGTSYLHAVAVSGSGMRSATSGLAVLRVDTTDPVTHLLGAPAGWTNRAVELNATASDSDSGMATVGGGPPPFTAIRVDDGAPAIAYAPAVATSVIAEGTHRVAYYARDAAGNADDGAAANGAPAHEPEGAWVRIDRTPPGVAFANSQDPGDPDLIRVEIADPLAGPDTSRGWIAVRRVGSGDAFERLPRATPRKGELRARWDSDTQPIGEYEFMAAGFDAAGNSTIATRRADGSPMVLANPLKATTSLRGAFARRGVSRMVGYGRGVRLHGRLITGLSTPLAGAAVHVVERFATGARPALRASSVATGPAGTFSFRSPPGPSRTIELSYAGSSTLARAAGPTLRVAVRSRIRLRASAGTARVGGKPIVFQGQVVVPPGTIPGSGMPVQLQFRLGNSPWSEFRTVQTNSRGRFRYAYRFTDDDSRGVRFQFRANLPAQENWPYEPGGSRPVIIKGS